MRTNPILRPRVPTEPVAGGMVHTGNGPYYDFNVPLGAIGGLYHFHEGDVFFPGAPSFVYETPFERTPINTLWGTGIIVLGQHQLMPFPESPMPMNPNIFTNGIGGLQAGEIYMQPLLDPGGDMSGVSS